MTNRPSFLFLAFFILIGSGPALADCACAPIIASFEPIPVQANAGCPCAPLLGVQPGSAPALADGFAVATTATGYVHQPALYGECDAFRQNCPEGEEQACFDRQIQCLERIGGSPVQSGRSLAKDIAGLYRDLLGREPEAGGLAGWMTVGNLDAIRQGILGSPEYAARQEALANRAAPQPANANPGCFHTIRDEAQGGGWCCPPGVAAPAGGKVVANC